MARRTNELYLGQDFLTIEGRSVKHPGRIELYANPNARKIHDEMIPTIGIDIETNHKTGDMKLLGVYDDENYRWYTSRFLENFVALLHYAISSSKSLVYWNKLDPFVLYRIFLEQFDMRNDEDKNRVVHSMERYGKVSGEWDKETHEWSVKPVVELQLGEETVGIKQVIRSSIQFFVKRPWKDDIETVWAYDIAQLFPRNLSKEAKRFSWYSKIAKEAHLVDWERFETNRYYRENIVLESNKLDARAVYELSKTVQKDFHKAFNAYPRTLISQGSLARASIVAILKQEYENIYNSEKEMYEKINEEIKSIGIMNYYDDWAEEYGKDFMKDLYCLTTEAYSGGYIEAIRYGFAKEGWQADLASAYPATISKLKDLRGAKLRKGTGEPPKLENGYVFIRGTVEIPRGVDYHPITIKHPLYEDTNIRATGIYKASYIYEEREYLLEKGAKFTDEEWYAIETSDKPSVLAKATQKFVALRQQMDSINPGDGWMPKTSASSIYGLTYEAVDTHEDVEVEKAVELEHDETYYEDTLGAYKKGIDFGEHSNALKTHYDSDYSKIRSMWHNDNGLPPDVVAEELKGQGVEIKAEHPVDIVIEIDGLYRMAMHKHRQTVHVKEDEVVRSGYRAGEFWNPIYASQITGETRVQMARASDAIAQNGGKPIVLMTDSILWEGPKDALPSKWVRKKKTLGYFEEPEYAKNIVCLGTGRYGFETEDGEYVAKKRGLNATDIHDPNGIEVEHFSWRKVLDIMEKTNRKEIEMDVRMLLSVGVVLHRHDVGLKDLGRIVTETRKAKALVGLNKRWVGTQLQDVRKLAHGMVKSEPLHLLPGQFGKYVIHDSTYPKHREKLMSLELKTKKEKRRNVEKKASHKYYSNHKATIRKNIKERYRILKEYGFEAFEAKRYSNWSDDSIQLLLLDRGLISNIQEYKDKVKDIVGNS